MPARKLPQGKPGETPAQVRDRLKAELEQLKSSTEPESSGDVCFPSGDLDASDPGSDYRKTLTFNAERQRWEHPGN